MIDARIFGVPERASNIEKMKKSLGNVTIIIDEEHDGCVSTAKRSWLLHTTASHVMILNDDVQLCDNFMEVCDTIVRLHPQSIISLFPVQFIGVNLNWVGGYPKHSPYVSTTKVSGAGIIMPTEYIKPCVDSWDPNTMEDDTSIELWAKANGIQILTTLPSTIQHLDLKSTLGHNPMSTQYFEQSPEANWENGFVTPWTNLIR